MERDMQRSSKYPSEKSAARLGPEAEAFRKFAVAAILCIAGLSTIVYVSLNLEASREQELIALTGLLVAAPSGLCAFYFYLRILWTRLKRFKDS